MRRGECRPRDLALLCAKHNGWVLQWYVVSPWGALYVTNSVYILGSSKVWGQVPCCCVGGSVTQPNSVLKSCLAIHSPMLYRFTQKLYIKKTKRFKRVDHGRAAARVEPQQHMPCSTGCLGLSWRQFWRLVRRSMADGFGGRPSPGERWVVKRFSCAPHTCPRGDKYRQEAPEALLIIQLSTLLLVQFNSLNVFHDLCQVSLCNPLLGVEVIWEFQEFQKFIK